MYISNNNTSNTNSSQKVYLFTNQKQTFRPQTLAYYNINQNQKQI